MGGCLLACDGKHLWREAHCLPVLALTMEEGGQGTPSLSAVGMQKDAASLSSYHSVPA